MFKKQHLALAIAATLAAGAAQAELETSVTLKNETAYMVKDGLRTGEATSTTDTTGEGKGVYKFENTAKIFLNDTLENGSSWHGELQVVRDTKAIDGYDGHEPNTQKDFLRELYVDTTIGDWDARIGKQQVVWGTADGIKLLDMINPTDWSEFNQNTMAEARIPVWMINAEKYLDNGANVQLIVSQPKENKIAGLNASGDQGHPFLMKGIDTMTGKVNGFYNIAPALSNVAGTFNQAAFGGFFDDATPAANNPAGLTPFGGMTVAGFAATDWLMADKGDGGFPDYVTKTLGGAPVTNNPNTGAVNGNSLLDIFTQDAFSNFGFPGGDDPRGNDNITKLTSGYTTWDPENPKSAFEYMPLATFSTFNTFTNVTGAGVNTYFSGTTTEWKNKDTSGANLAARFRNTTSNGLNYSFNYAYAYGSNPDVNLNWVDPTTKEVLTVQRAPTVCYDTNNGGGVVGACDMTGEDTFAPFLGADLTRDQARANWTTNPMTRSHTTILVKNSAGQYYGAINPYAWAGGAVQSADVDGDGAYDNVTTATTTTTNTAPTLQFEQSLHRSHMIGTSFDYALDFENPVVLRGEFLYEKDATQPVVDKFLLAIGDLTNALKMEKADYFKYVIGADTTVMTDMMLSGQFIQFRNLDYIDSPDTCTTQADLVNNNQTYNIDCSRYTGDLATLHLSNGMQKAEENKNFYSVFLSKPFGESGEGRWNNIFIYEEGGGKWNRFDVEYGINDQLIGTFEYNKYFGDENTMFGQFANASNVQIGLKYLLQ